MHSLLRPATQVFLCLWLSTLFLTGCGPKTSTREAAKQENAPSSEDAVATAEEGDARSRKPQSPDESAGRKQSQAARESIDELKAAGAEIVYHDDGYVSEVHLRDVETTDALALELGSLGKLFKLTISNSAMSDQGWQELGKLSELQQFDLRGCQLGNQQLIASVSGMPKLRALRLSGQNGATVDDEGLTVLAGLPELKALALDHLWVSEEGLRHLKNNRKLTELYLAGTLVDDTAMEFIATISSLRKIRIAQTSVSELGLAALVEIPIEDIDLSECSQLTDEAMAYVGKWKSLKRLNLWRDPVSDVGVAHLADLKELEWLNLDNTGLSDAGLKDLSGMQKLNFLHLGSTAVSDTGMPDLLKLVALKELNVTRSSVTEAGAKLISDGIPGVHVQLRY